MLRSDLHKYQLDMIDFIKAKDSCALFVDMGLGKTIATLTALSDALKSTHTSPVKALVIAPLRVCTSVWAQEALKWDHTKHLKISICTGTVDQRIAGLCYDANIYVINKENVPWLVNVKHNNWVFKTVVIDESSTFKSAKSKRFKALRKLRGKIDKMILLTGTPAPNSLMDLWSQMYLVDKGDALGRTLTNYRRLYFDQSWNGFTYTLKDKAAPAIHARLADKTLSLRACDHIDLPGKIDVTVQVDMPPAVKNKYKQFEKDMIIEHLSGDVTAVNAAVLVNKLFQSCNGFNYLDDGGTVDLHDAKLDALSDIVDENPTENLLVAYHYKHDLKRLIERFPQAQVMDKSGATVEAWNRGEIKMLLVHPASAGHGINLQRGGSVIVWFGLTWSLEQYQQLNARLHRQGQKDTVRVLHLVTNGTIEDRMRKVLTDKDTTQSDLIKYLSTMEQ